MTKSWQQFLFCVILTILWPLFPLGFEWLISDAVKTESVALTASMYAIGIGVASKYQGLFGVALMEAVFYILFYGLSVKGHPPHEALILFVCGAGMFLMFVCHTAERYNRHIRLQEPFPDFMR
ncbi:conserved membrane hypothetical protein [Paraburkholderia ribeironis]|uniref:Transmembrane protein n=1 Tax=Paraburkholderia ribeironis TaxID=1247936 RepID=A0A1N7SLA2_9BURK|nr:conserved membrane hypothetical protein [Paraburkholderia ribeironis]